MFKHILEWGLLGPDKVPSWAGVLLAVAVTHNWPFSWRTALSHMAVTTSWEFNRVPLHPSNPYIGALTPSTSKYELVWRSGLFIGNQVKIKMIRVSPSSI